MYYESANNISFQAVPTDNYQPKINNVYPNPIIISGINSAALLAAMNKSKPLYIWAIYPKENKTFPFRYSPIGRMDLRVWELTHTSPLLRLSPWESVVTSWPQLSPALSLLEGQATGSPVDTWAWSLSCCHGSHLAGSCATRCGTSLPAEVPTSVNMCSRYFTNVYFNKKMTERRMKVLLESDTDGSNKCNRKKNII